MNPSTGLVAGLSDRLLFMEHTAFAQMEAVGEASWRYAEASAVRRWRRGRRASQQNVINGWQQDAERCAASLTQVGMRLLADADEMLDQTLLAELSLVEKGLGGVKYAGVADEVMDAMPRYVWLATAAGVWQKTVASAAASFTGAVSVRVADCVRRELTGKDMAAEVFPEWRSMVTAAKGEVRMVEFGFVNGMRAQAIELVDQAADRR